MRLGLGAVGEEAGGLDDDVDSEVAPRKVARLAVGQDLDGLAVGDDAVFGRDDLVERAAVDRVVLQQMGHRGNVTEVVDRNHFDVRVVRHRAIREATDATKTVNTYLRCHTLIPFR